MGDHLQPVERMKKAWDRMAADYTLHTELSPSDPHYQALADQCPATSLPLAVLDLGSGLGFALDAILPKIPNAAITCLDISNEMLKGLVERFRARCPRIVTRNESYVDAELGCERFDLIVSAFTLHHLTEAAKLPLFRKIQAALKEHGRYLELDGVASPEQEQSMQLEFEKLLAHRDGSERGEWNFDLLLTIEHEKNLMLQAGFSSVDVPWTDIDAAGKGRAVFAAAK